jgi:hypothetical protein
MGDDTKANDTVADETTETTDALAWHGVLAPMGVLSGDGRKFPVGGITNRDLPLPMRWVEKDEFGHAGAETVGNIETIAYGEDGLIHFTGHRLDTERAQLAAEQIAGGALRGVTVDHHAVTETYENEDGMPFDPESWDMGDPEPIAIVSGRIAAATIVAIPAFQEAFVALGVDGAKPEFEEALTAAASPSYALAAKQTKYPADWFLDPEFSSLTPLTITEDGRVFGHVAGWDTCHLGFSLRECVTAPHSNTDYGYFLNKSVLTEHGELPVGTVVLDTSHAALTMNIAQAAAHYDDTGKAVAFINVGEDKHGIWFAGAIREDATAQEIEALRGSALSGDWRPTRHGREFCAVLGVNTPGFPVPRVEFAQTALGTGALVAAGMVRPHKVARAGSAVDYAKLASSVVDEIEKRQADKERRDAGLARLRAGGFTVAADPETAAADSGALLAQLRSL